MPVVCLYQVVASFRSKGYALCVFILPTVPCRVFTNNYYSDCSSHCEFYSLQSTSVLRISFGLFMSSEREGEQKGRGYSPHFTSEDVEA